MNHPQSLSSNSQAPSVSSIQSTHTRLAPLPPANLREFLLWMVGRRKRFRVSGPSMLPLLQPDEEVLVHLNAYSSGHTPQPGEIVIVVHPHHPSLRMVKRVIEVIGEAGEAGEAGEQQGRGGQGAGETEPLERYYWVEGDNPLASTDSRTFGAVPSVCILGKVTARFGQEG